MLVDFIQTDNSALGTVVHFAWRREYQTRGLQHFHILIWVKDAPIIGESSSEKVADIINKHITCKKPDPTSFPTLAKRVSDYQTHHHNNYCMRAKKTKTGTVRVCRFSFPRNISDSLVLRDVSESIAGRHCLKSDCMTFHGQLMRLILMITTRQFCLLGMVIWIYNLSVKNRAHLAHTKYQTKAEKSNTVDTFDVMNSVKTLQQKLWNIAMRTLSSRECGIMEACDALLGNSLFGTDKDTIIRWLDVNIARSRKLKEIPRKIFFVLPWLIHTTPIVQQA